MLNEAPFSNKAGFYSYTIKYDNFPFEEFQSIKLGALVFQRQLFHCHKYFTVWLNMTHL